MCGNQADTYYFDDFETTITDTEGLSTAKYELDNRMVSYPNPSMNFVNVKLLSLEKNIKNIKIIDLNGRIVAEYHPKFANDLKINTNKLENGMYLMQVTTSDNKVLRPKSFVIAR